MGNFKHDHESPLDFVVIQPAPESHILIINEELCKQCENKPCTYYCPSRVYSWDEGIQVNYVRCIECGACPYACPQQNIAWQYPDRGYGVQYGILTERRLKAESGVRRPESRSPGGPELWVLSYESMCPYSLGPLDP